MICFYCYFYIKNYIILIDDYKISIEHLSNFNPGMVQVDNFIKEYDSHYFDFDYEY